MAPRYDPLPQSAADAENEVKRSRSRSFPSFFRVFRKFKRVCRPIYVVAAVTLVVLWQILFNASYTKPPKFEVHPTETVFIAANIIDGDLINGAWGDAIEELVNLLGKDRTFVSVYGGPKWALDALDARLDCPKKIVAEADEPIDLDGLPRCLLPSGEERIKRIQYLAEVRNKALEPLDSGNKTYDRVLFLNDVYFNAMDAARLLWGTKKEYKAVCATDFVTSWKLYDTFATRDTEHYSMGVPIYPWFVNEGEALSRKDVLAGKDAVRVTSCWGGMVAFDGRYLQSSEPLNRTTKSPETTSFAEMLAQAETDASQPRPPAGPLRFRAEMEAFWDSSECCLINADLGVMPTLPDVNPGVKHDKDEWKAGIYMNPFVRVAYSKTAFERIWFAKRFERVLELPQRMINYFANMPHTNVRRQEHPGDIVKDRLWVYDRRVPNADSDDFVEFGDEEDSWQGSSVARRKHPKKHAKRGRPGHEKSQAWWDSMGHYEDFDRTSHRGEWCGTRQLTVLKEGQLEEGEGNWDHLIGVVPPLEPGNNQFTS